MEDSGCRPDLADFSADSKIVILLKPRKATRGQSSPSSFWNRTQCRGCQNSWRKMYSAITKHGQLKAIHHWQLSPLTSASLQRLRRFLEYHWKQGRITKEKNDTANENIGEYIEFPGTGNPDPSEILKPQLEVAKYKQRYETTRKQLQRMGNKYEEIKNGLHKVLNDDQLQKLASNKVQKWTKETVQNALQIRYHCGVSGYNFLCKQFPLPSYSSLCRRIQKFPLECGIMKETISLLEEKGSDLPKNDKHVILALDEMTLKPDICYDKGQKKTIGKCTLGNTEETATKLLVLAARGVTKRWKQIIGVHLVNDVPPPGDTMLQFVTDGVIALENAGFSLAAVVSDMGAENRAMWRAAGLKVTSNLRILTMKHPTKANEELPFLADTYHLLKNLRSCFLKYDIKLPDDVVKRENFETNMVSSSWLREYIGIKHDKNENEDGPVFVPASHITNDVLDPSHYDVMKVNLARSLFCDKTVNALNVAMKRGFLPSAAAPPAWFIQQVSNWYELVSSRHP
ncbi:hypothetical protein B566_EDAN018019 [Ephemera danica]|nr:hypothetical protein B566_EDAN018019 [Ephemera danica]